MQKGFWSTIKKPVIALSPMDGVTDFACRYITKKYGKPSLIFTEFTCVEAFKYGKTRGLQNLRYSKTEHPIVAQLYGKDPEAFYLSCLICCQLGFDGIDINMGCPSKGVSGNGAGGALIKNPELAVKIIKTCQQAVKDWSKGKTPAGLTKVPELLALFKTKKSNRKIIPISIKTRIGFDKIVTKKWINTLLKTKPAAICIHGRTLKQMYSGQANWEEIGKAAKIIKKTSTLVLGNGDIKSIEDAEQKIKKHQLDGVLIGRASMGNPWIFNGRSPALQQRMKVLLEHAKYYDQHRNNLSYDFLKKHLGWYCKEFTGAKEIRQQLMQTKNYREVKNILLKSHLIKKNLK
jgi:tRNA-dihydrouridine synthase B